MSSNDCAMGEGSLDDNKSLVSVTDFDFINLMDMMGFQTALETSFPHVEASVDSGIKEKMVVEIPISKDGSRFWLATITSVHGILVRLTVVESEKEMWLDVSKNKLYPLGWCQMNKIFLEPPQEIKDRCPTWQNLALQYLEDISIDTVCDYHCEGEGITPAERLKPGMELLLQDNLNPNQYHDALIEESKGGLLQLKVDDKTETVFYTSKRLKRKVGEKCIPQDILPSFTPSKHNFKVGTMLEIIPDGLSEKVELAKVDKIWNDKYFQVALESNAKKFLCHKESNNIFPLGWSETHLGGDERRAATKPKVTKAADKNCFPKNRKSITEDEFEPGQKFEVQLDQGSSEMRMCTALKIHDSVLLVQLDDDDAEKKNILLLAFPSDRIFPLGWANSNYLPCKIPKSYLAKVESNSIAVETKKPEKVEEESSSWCPLVYFNYQCYSASFLSKARLASLPKSVGPGSVHLVMKKVLELIIRSSYKSASVLKRLGLDEDERPRRDFIVEKMRGKSRQSASLSADIEIPTKAEQVSLYCREVCQKVGACPYLLSTTLYDKECPANCQSKPKSGFHAEEQSGIMFRNRNRKGFKRRRNFDAAIASGNNNNPNNKSCVGDNAAAPKGESSSSDNESDETNEPPSTVHSRSTSPTAAENNPGKKRRKEWENILPKSGIRTRGAKLPDFKLHFKIRPSKKEQKEMEQNSLKDSLGVTKKATPGKIASKIIGKGRNAKCSLEPAFKMANVPDPSTQPPPIREIKLKSNPVDWSSKETALFLAQTEDCSHLAPLILGDDIDGISFMLLNFPTAVEYWSLTVGSAIRLCQHIESVKVAYYEQFILKAKS